MCEPVISQETQPKLTLVSNEPADSRSQEILHLMQN